MLTKEEFDDIIRANLIKHDNCDNFGYQADKTSKFYKNYYKKEVFDEFKKDPNLPKYKGDELNSHGTKPPKMASMGSSSRFCYVALSGDANVLDGARGVEFEKACPINGIKGTPPQLDAYIPEGNIYIEAKCHEIFDSHELKMSTQYWNLIFGIKNKFGFEAEEKPQGQYFEIPLKKFGLDGKVTMFDFKQFLCHLLGIDSQSDKQATLVYLFFKPTGNAAVDKLFCRLKEEVDSIFNNDFIKAFCGDKINLKAVVQCAPVMSRLNYENCKDIMEM